jgi:hypothetical protein
LIMSNTDDNFGLSKAISRSKLNMPDADFEQRVMAQVFQESNKTKNSRAYIGYAMLFFVLFVVAGCLASSSFMLLPQTGIISQQMLKLIFEAGFVLCTLLQAEKFIHYFKRNKAHMA